MEEEDWFIGNEVQKNREKLNLLYPISRASVTNWDHMEKVGCSFCGGVEPLTGPPPVPSGGPAAWHLGTDGPLAPRALPVSLGSGSLSTLHHGTNHVGSGVRDLGLNPVPTIDDWHLSGPVTSLPGLSFLICKTGYHFSDHIAW